MDYDITLKELFHRLPTGLLNLLVQQPVVETLTVEYPSVRRRLPDLVLRLASGGIYHLELQSDNDSFMPWRMLEYYCLIRAHFEQSPLQQVLYVGPGKPTFKAKISEPKGVLRFKYPLINCQKLDGRPLLASPLLEDNILSLLCRLPDLHQAARMILQKLLTLDENQRRDALEKLLIVAKLRDLQPFIHQELKTMPITVNWMDYPMVQELVEQARDQALQTGRQEGHREGRQEGEYALLASQLTHRFGPLPPATQQRLQSAEPADLERWGLALLTAQTLEEVFR